MFHNPDDEIIREILSQHRIIAVVGCSPKEHRDSNRIAAMLMSRGHTIVPVNPGHHQILGLPCYPDLLSIPCKIEMVDIFRRPEYLPGIADQAVAIGARIFWTQLGVYNEEAAEKAKQAGMIVVMDRCPAIEYRRLQITNP